MNRHISVARFTLVCSVSSLCAIGVRAAAQDAPRAEADAPVAPIETIEPVERTRMLERVVVLDGVGHRAVVDHVHYAAEDMRTIYHRGRHVGEDVSEPVPHKQCFIGVEIMIAPLDAGDDELRTVSRLSAPPLEARIDVGFLVAPPVVGVGVRDMPDGDRLLVTLWNLSTNWWFCAVFDIDPSHTLLGIPRDWHHYYLRGQKVPDPWDVFTNTETQAIAKINVGREFKVDPDCALFVSGDADTVELVIGSWSRTEYQMETHVCDLNTGDVAPRPAMPQERSLFDQVPRRAGPPPRIDYSKLPKPNPWGCAHDKRR